VQSQRPIGRSGLLAAVGSPEFLGISYRGILIGISQKLAMKKTVCARPGGPKMMTDDALRRDLIQMLTARGMTERQAERFLEAREAPRIEA